MIRVDVFFTPSEFTTSYRKDNVVVIGIDILRAGTTICKALQSGAKEIIPVGSSEDALGIYFKFDRSTALLCGERNGNKIEGYHLGNSPLEYETDLVAGKTLILNTTNGSLLFKRLLPFPFFYIGCFANSSVLISKVIEIINNIKDISHILLICAGQDNKFTFEDALFCGFFIELLQSKLENVNAFDFNDAAIASLDLAKVHRNDFLSFAKTTEHSKQLIHLGFEKDLDIAFSLESIPILPSSNGLSIVST